jgi:hypothetical protein
MNLKSGWVVSLIALLLFSAAAQAQIYKIVDKDGNVTFTDQRPADGGEPMVLPELSVIETDLPDKAVEPAVEETTAEPEMTRREMRKLFSDFQITRPKQEETFWGTSNAVVISWASTAPLQPEMNVKVYVDGVRQADSADGMIALTLDRGEHKAYVELVDARGRTVTTTQTVTFFVMQRSVGFSFPYTLPANST